MSQAYDVIFNAPMSPVNTVLLSSNIFSFKKIYSLQ